MILGLGYGKFMQFVLERTFHPATAFSNVVTAASITIKLHV